MNTIWSTSRVLLDLCYGLVEIFFPLKESEEEDASESDDDEDAPLPQTTRQSGMN